MSAFSARPYEGPGDLALLIDLARDAMAARWPLETYWHIGDIVWQFLPLGSAALDDVRLWFDDAGLAGFVLFEPPLTFGFDVRAGLPLDGPMIDEMLGWAEARRRALIERGAGPVPRAYSSLADEAVSAAVLESDHARIAILEKRGYVPTELHSVRYRRSLEDLPPVVLPPGFRLRHAVDSDIEERAELHRDAWSVWGPSQFSAERYRRLRAAPVYDETLDIVVEAGDRHLVSSCIFWADAKNGVATFEPVGTRRAYTGRGLARAAISEAFHRLRERGLHTARGGTSSVNERALALYPSCGFELVDRERYYAKPIR